MTCTRALSGLPSTFPDDLTVIDIISAYNSSAESDDYKDDNFLT